MIKIENTEVYGWESAIRGMRNPMNSWDKSDSWFPNTETAYWDSHDINKEFTVGICSGGKVKIGDNDFALMKQLVRVGTDHSKFLRMIIATCDITAPLYWHKENDTYKIGTVRNSCSTMHKIHAKEFTFDDFSSEHLSRFPYGLNGEDYTVEVDSETMFGCDFLDVTIRGLNHYREKFLETKDKTYWWHIIQLLPNSYNQRSTFQYNYAVLRNIYHSRKSHKLDEWRDFCKWIESLPYNELITMKGQDKNAE